MNKFFNMSDDALYSALTDMVFSNAEDTEEFAEALAEEKRRHPWRWN